MTFRLKKIDRQFLLSFLKNRTSACALQFNMVLCTDLKSNGLSLWTDHSLDMSVDYLVYF